MNNTSWGQVIAQEGNGFKVRLYYDNTLFMLEWNKLQKSIPILESVVTSAEKGIEERVEEILDMQEVLNSIIKTRVSAKRNSDVMGTRKAFDRALEDRNYQQSQVDDKQALVDQKTTEKEQIQVQWDQADALAKQYAIQNPDEDNPYEPNPFDNTLKGKEQELKDAEKNLELAQSDLRIYQRIFDEKKLAYENLLTLGNVEEFTESVRRVSTEIAFYEEDLNAIRRGYTRQKAQLLTAQERRDYLRANYPYTLIYEIQSVNGSVSVGEWVHVLTVQGFTEEVINKIKELYTTIASQQQIILEKFFEIDKLYEQIVPLQNKVDRLYGEKWQLQEARAFFMRWGDQEKASQYDERISRLNEKIEELKNEIEDLKGEEEDKRDLIEESNKAIGTSILQIEKEKSSDQRYFIAKVTDARPIGKLRRSVASTAAQTFFNFAILPGWQKYYPTYRLGTITFMYKQSEEDGSYRYLCDVTLDDRFSECQGLSINLKDKLKEVSFESYLIDEFFDVYIIRQGGIDGDDNSQEFSLSYFCHSWNKNFTGSYSGKKCLINFPERNWEKAMVVWIEGKNVDVEGFYLQPIYQWKWNEGREYQLYYRKDGVNEMRRQFSAPAQWCPDEAINGPGWMRQVPIYDIFMFVPIEAEGCPVIYSKITDTPTYTRQFFDESGTLINIEELLDKEGNLRVCDFRVVRGSSYEASQLLETPPYKIWYICRNEIEPYSRCNSMYENNNNLAIREFCNTTSSTASSTPAQIQSSLSKDTSPTPSGIRCYGRAEQDGLAYCWPLAYNSAVPEEKDKTDTKSSITVKREKKKVIAELFVIRANLSGFSIGRSWGTGLGKLEDDPLTQTALSICKKLPEEKKKLTWLPSVVDFGFAAPCRDSNAPATYATANASTLPATTGFLGLFCKGTTPPPPKVTLEIILSGVLNSTGEVYYVTLKHERTNDSPFPPIPPHLTIVSVNYEVTPDTSRYFKKGVGRGIMVSEDSTTDYKILSTATGKVMSENNTHGTLKSIGACVSVVSLPCFSIKSICLNAIASSEVCFKTRTICLMHEQPDDNEDVTYEVKFELVINEDGEPELKRVVTEKRTRLCSSNIFKIVTKIFAITTNTQAVATGNPITTLTILANSRNARSGPPALPKILSVMVQPVPMSISSSGMSSASIEPMLISSIGMSTYSPIQLDIVQTFYGHSYTATPQPFNWGILFKMGGNPLFPFNWESLTFILKVKNPRYIYSHVDLPRPGLYPGLGRWSGVARTAGIKGVCRAILKLSEGNRLGFKFGFAEMFAEKRKPKKLSLVSDSLVLTTCSKKREVGFVTTSSVTVASVYHPEVVAFLILPFVTAASVYHASQLPAKLLFCQVGSKLPHTDETPCLKTFTNVLTRNDLHLPLKCHATSSLGQELAKLNAGAAIAKGKSMNKLAAPYAAASSSQEMNKPITLVAVGGRPITSPKFIITCATNNKFSLEALANGDTESDSMNLNLLFQGITTAVAVGTKLFSLFGVASEANQAKTLAYLLQQTDEEIQATTFNLFLKAVHLIKSDGLYETPSVTAYSTAIAHDETKGLAPTAKGTYAHARSFLEKGLSPQTKIPLNTQTATLSSIPSGEFGDAISILWKQEPELPLLGRALLYNSSFLAKKVYPIQAIFNLGLVGLETRNYAYATLNLPVNFTVYAYTSSCKECTKNCLVKCINEKGEEYGRPIDFIDTIDLITNLTVYSIPIP